MSPPTATAQLPPPRPPAPRLTRLTRFAGGAAAALREAHPGESVVDGALAGVFLVAMAGERLRAAAEIGSRMPAALLLTVVIAGMLAVRRRAPVAAYLAGSAALAAEAQWLVADPVSPYANLIGLYSLGLYATRTRARFGPLAVLLGMAGYFADRSGGLPEIPGGVLFLWLLAWALGYATARRQEDRARARRRLRHQVAAEERAWIARELHDLVGHTVNVMLVQAGAARRTLERDRERATELLSGLEQTGREALDELDRVLGLLRRDAAPAFAAGHDPAPSLQPGLADLPRLAARLAQAGTRVTLRLAPSTGRLPATVDRSAYRIVQEALTNSVKHGRAAGAEVVVGRRGATLEIVVRDNGCGPAPGYAPGRGLLGIAERVAVLGGTVRHGGGDGGGFQLRALLPLS
ncbi:sensor histidine kinase [Kitasatospora sp. NPDC057223]|uniref:sensor histidine kinase n=1 Tax=Kitasatospora sp. NPDC057223 TaxID=3346055 RepID=UPI003639FA8B